MTVRPSKSPPSAVGARRVGVARELSKRGVCSRTAASVLVEAGRVRLDGRIVRDPETPTTADSRIAIDGVPVRARAHVYLMLNKPRGLVTTTADERGRKTVYDCLRDAALPWVAPVGRLDKASEGLLLFTNDGAWAAGLLDPAHHVEKTYHVQIGGLPDDTLAARLREGTVVADGTRLAARRARVLRAGERNGWLEIVLDEGRNRHLRRLLEALDREVLRLVRVAIGPLALGTLAKGGWRMLTASEIRILAKADDS